MLTALRKIYDFAGNWQGVLKKSVAFSLLHSIFDMFQIAALFLILIGLTEGMTLQIIVFTLLLLIIGILGKIYCSYISDFSQTKVGYYMCAEKRIHVGDRMKYMPMGYFNDHSLGKLTSAVTTTIGDVENNAPSVLITVVHGFVHVVVITIVMFFFDWRIGSLCCLGILLFLVCNSMMQKKSQKISLERQRAQEDLVGATLEYIQGMNIVKSFNLGGNSNQKMKQAIEESRVRNTKLETVFIPYGAAQQFVLRLISVSIMFCSILFYLQGSMTLVYCLLMCVASFLIFSELEKAGGKSFALRLIESSIDKINEIDETPIMDLSGQNITPPNMDIELKDVSFSYGEHQIFRCINLSVPSRTTLAIVGPSGSGKTTLCSLIARFWDVQSGSITLGGTDIRDYTLDKLLSNFSIVFQNVYLFADTIENNIRFGKPDASHDEVVRVAKKACCHDFIMALPKGYDTVIGESGATLSGGEKQRISIARAILKDAPIVILDEATSSVDPENESDLQAAIESLTESKTVITIAHRLKTVKNADQIVVIADGKITQRGTHEQLKMQSGIYADFINIRHKTTGWKLVQ
ncbi:ABC transporter ATP-binding protein [Blautia sp. 2744]|uniref:ABC transporter ATP-binding protein n=3 Tax=Clostridia TaxID=186801 RepID=A0A8I0ACH6_9FIRM|nr:MULTISPECIES: ABC transporter ATP-binding protein [Clostridia]MBC5757285.1 ABC transporter ATP-binding protein [Blautia tarda]MBC3532625.1 ABC transporter ATP-binding protein [Blautia massiliensis (ex Durand et al. 2017)]MBC5650533.1 ABC transporter ATP-binding protein [Blautia segnis]MBC5684039.1 ABC transporter ATP-binding protein [Ruminococcus hominis]MBC5739389.1 ABC transporter ATP-binding protein [Blautia intestinalis]